MVEYLLDSDAVSAGIIDSVFSMTSHLSPGDRFELYFAGHGREDLNGVHNLIGYDGHSDPRIPQGAIPVSGLIAASDVPSVNRLLILDCCRVDLLAGRGVAYCCPESRDVSLKKVCREAARALPPFILNSCCTGEQAFELPNEKRGGSRWKLPW